VPDGLKAAGAVLVVRSSMDWKVRARHVSLFPSGIHREQVVEQAWHIARWVNGQRGPNNRLDRTNRCPTNGSWLFRSRSKRTALYVGCFAERPFLRRRKKERMPRKTSPRVCTRCPCRLGRILRADRAALALWEDITPLARNEWISGLRTPRRNKHDSSELKEYRSYLKAGKRRRVCWPGCPTPKSARKPSAFSDDNRTNLRQRTRPSFADAPRGKQSTVLRMKAQRNA